MELIIRFARLLDLCSDIAAFYNLMNNIINSLPLSITTDMPYGGLTVYAIITGYKTLYSIAYLSHAKTQEYSKLLYIYNLETGTHGDLSDDDTPYPAGTSFKVPQMWNRETDDALMGTLLQEFCIPYVLGHTDANSTNNSSMYENYELEMMEQFQYGQNFCRCGVEIDHDESVCNSCIYYLIKDADETPIFVLNRNGIDWRMFELGDKGDDDYFVTGTYANTTWFKRFDTKNKIAIYKIVDKLYEKIDI